MHIGNVEKGTDQVPKVPALEAGDRACIEAVRAGDGSKLRSTYADAPETVAVALSASRSLEWGGEWLTPGI